MSPDFPVAEQRGVGAPQPPVLVPQDAWSSMEPQSLTFQGDSAALWSPRFITGRVQGLQLGWVRCGRT